jgi:GAF domain-containing protein
MRRGVPKTKNVKRGSRRRSAAAKSKTRSQQAAVPKHAVKARDSIRKAPQTPAKSDEDVGALKRALAEADQREAATADVLKVISRSTFDLQTVFNTLVQSAAQLCEADDAAIHRPKDDTYPYVARYGFSPEFDKFMKDHPIQRGRGTLVGRTALEGRTLHIPDVLADPEYTFVEAQRVGRWRTALGVPLLREGSPIGVLIVARRTVRPFTDKQIELVETFADQAVIAIENARLFEEVQVRTKELTESLEQQTATSEVLQVISSSPGELQPVFEAMLEKATRVCNAEFGTMTLQENGSFRNVALYNMPPAFVEFIGRDPLIHPPRDGVLSRVAQTKQPIHIADYKDEAVYLRGFEPARMLVDVGGARSVLGVPMLKEGELVGVIMIFRQVVLPFTEKQIETVANFAAQAVIAIENTRLLNELRQRTDDLSEALDRQTATSEVLSVISSSPNDLQPVFDKMLENATRLCGAPFGLLSLYDGEVFRSVAAHNVPPTFADFRRSGSQRPHPKSGIAQLLDTRQPVQITDLSATQPYSDRDPLTVAGIELGGIKTLLHIPLLKGGEVIGRIAIYRQEVRPFTDKQIELVQNFATQAVIAIENARLLKELRESLQQQTATSEVLQVISSSPGQLLPVFEKMLEQATRVCEAKFGAMLLQEGGEFRQVAEHNLPFELTELMRREPRIRAPTDSPMGRVAQSKQVVHVADVREEPAYIRGAAMVRMADTGGARTLLYVPMLKEGELIGVIGIYRQVVRPFTDKQIEIVSNFAKQAVIAIENTRLLNELRESLQQQTATADVLKVISRSTFDLKTVLSTLIESAVSLCEADIGNISRPIEGGVFQVEASCGQSAALTDVLTRSPLKIGKGSVTGRAALNRATVHILDAQTDPDYELHEARKIGDYHTVLGVPLLREGNLVGVLGLARKTVRAFTDKQIELVTTFADQAVIAIENARLFDEVQSRTRQLAQSVDELRALGDVSQAVNSTLDLATVLSTIVSRAVQLSGTEAGTIYEFDEQRRELQQRSSHGMSDELIQALGDQHLGIGEPIIDRAVVCREPVQIEDLAASPSTPARDIVVRAGYRALLVVPLLGRDHVMGTLVVRRQEPGAFRQNTVELLKTFAAQSVLAIQNAHLFTEIDEKSRQLEIASQHKSQFLANMSHELRTPLNAILGYTELILDNIYGETPDKMREVLERLQTNGKHLLGLINDVLDLSKIEAGQLTLDLADYSLKNVVDTVVVAVESLVAGKKLSLTTVVPLNLPVGHGDERRLTQVLLNLVGNAIKFTDKGEVAIEANASDGSFTVAVRDTGPGISPSDQGKIFEEFQQADSTATKKKGGTGLGLSIARRIIAMHGGRIWVESDVGKGSRFAFTIPVRVERQVTEP